MLLNLNLPFERFLVACHVWVNKLRPEEGGQLQVGPDLGRDLVEGPLGVQRTTYLIQDD